MDNKLITQHSNAIQKGERSRILYELFLDALGMSYENTFKEVLEAMKSTQEQYETAVNFFGSIMKAAHDNKSDMVKELPIRQEREKTGGSDGHVSVSH